MQDANMTAVLVAFTLIVSAIEAVILYIQRVFGSYADAS